MGRGKHGVFGFSLLVLAGVWPAAQAAPPANADLAAKAWGILRAHCLPCHGDAPKAAPLKILDHSELVYRRKVVIPDKAESSELFDLVRGKTMPPGNRPKVEKADLETLQRWIDNGAPSIYGDRYVVDHILRDWDAVLQAERRSTRYLSLNHLAHPSRPPDRLSKAHEQLKLTLEALAKAGAKLRPIDPEETVFRINLRDLGWDATPFHEIELVNRGENKDPERKDKGASSVNLYDLLLLEYPYGVLDFSSPHMPALARMFAEARAVRPVPYLRGDWVVATMTQTPMGNEFAEALARPRLKPETGGTVGLWGEEVSLQEAADDLEWKRSLPELKKALAKEDVQEPIAGKPIYRRRWEMVLPRLVIALSTTRRVPIIPINGLTTLENRPTEEFTYSLTTMDWDAKKEKVSFWNGDKFYLDVKASVNITLQRLDSNKNEKPTNGKITWMDPKPHSLDEGAYTVKNGKKNNEPFIHQSPVGIQYITTYAFAQSVLTKHGGNFPSGKLIGSPKKEKTELRDRYIHHSLYQLNATADKFEGPPVHKMLKKTLTIETRPSKKK